MPKSLSFFVHTAGPNHALVKSTGRKDVKIVIGGRLFAIPIFQRVDVLSLKLRTITVRTTHGLTINGVNVDVTSACQVKVKGWNSPEEMSGVEHDDDDDHHRIHVKKVNDNPLTMDHAAIRLAAQHFLGKKDEEIEDAIQKTVSGHQRAIIGCLTVEELYRDRAAFCRRVLTLIDSDMRNMGLVVVSYTVAEISDGNGYIEALGVTQTETVKREAVEGAALHRAAAKSRSAREDAGAHLEVNMQTQRKIESDKQREIVQAKAREQVERQRAIQEKANAISSAEQDAILLVARQRASAAETQAELEVMKQKVLKEKLMMEKHVHVEADALLYKAKVNADSIRASAAAEAERVRLIGEAQADAIRQKGLAEVDILRERNKAWAESINSGAILEKIVAILPEVARAMAAPLAKTEKMVFVGGGSGGGGGPAQFTNDFKKMMAQTPEVVKALTGVDLEQAVRELGNSTTGNSVLQGAADGMASSIVGGGMPRRVSYH